MGEDFKEIGNYITIGCISAREAKKNGSTNIFKLYKKYKDGETIVIGYILNKRVMFDPRTGVLEIDDLRTIANLAETLNITEEIPIYKQILQQSSK